MDKQEKTILVLVFPSLGFVFLMLFSHKKSLCSRYKSGLLHFMRRKCSLVGGQVEGGSGELGPLNSPHVSGCTVGSGKDIGGRSSLKSFWACKRPK